MLILKISSVLAISLLSIFIFYPLIIKKDFHEALAFIIAAAVEYGIYFYAKCQQKKMYSVRNYLFAVYCLSFFSMLFFGVYIEVTSSSIIPSVNFYMFLLFSQVLFIFDPV
ncbi:MAG: hypothetical protein LBV20_00640, partial [Treponema sp.]|nr:hypothetical protein [Treponema sp.]